MLVKHRGGTFESNNKTQEKKSLPCLALALAPALALTLSPSFLFPAFPLSQNKENIIHMYVDNNFYCWGDQDLAWAVLGNCGMSLLRGIQKVFEQCTEQSGVAGLN